MEYRDKIFSENELLGQQITGAKFTACRFVGVRLKFGSFVKCIFERCDFTGVSFDATSFEECKFPESKLSYLDFSSVSFIKCDFSCAVIESSVFQRIKTGSKNETIKLDLRDCVFKKTELSGTIFLKCNLEKVNFSGAILKKTSFDRCKLNSTRLVGADITGASFEGSIIDKTELDYDGFLAYGASRGFTLGAET